MKPKQIVGSAANACVQGNFTLDCDKNTQNKIDSRTYMMYEGKATSVSPSKISWILQKKKWKSAQKAIIHPLELQVRSPSILLSR